MSSESSLPASLPPGSSNPNFPKLIDHALLAPDLSEEDVLEGCRRAREWGIASVLVRPSDADQAVRWMDGSSVVVGAAIDFPHGHSTTTVKVYAARDGLRRGVREIETPMNFGKLLARQFQYLETELLQMAQACHESGALLKVRLDNGRMNEELRFLSCRILKRAGADFVVLDGVDDLEFFRVNLRDRLRIKVTGIPSFDAALQAETAGVSRFEGDAATLISDWRKRASDPSRL